MSVVLVHSSRPISVTLAIAGGLRSFAHTAATLPNLLLGNATGAAVLAAWNKMDVAQCVRDSRDAKSAAVRAVYNSCAPSLNLSRVELHDPEDLTNDELTLKALNGAPAHTSGWKGAFYNSFSQFTLWSKAMALARAEGSEVIVKTRPDLVLHRSTRLTWIGRDCDDNPLVRFGGSDGSSGRVLTLANDTIYTLMSDVHERGRVYVFPPPRGRKVEGICSRRARILLFHARGL